MTPDRFERAIAFQREVMRRTSTRIEPLPYGTGYLNAGLPHRFSSNLIWVDPGARAPDARTLVGDAERILGDAGAAHRKVNVDGEPGRALAPAFLELGWTVDRLLVMTLERKPDRPSSLPVQRVGYEVVRPLVETIARRNEVTADEAILRELVSHKSVLERTVGTSFFVARVDGAIAAECELSIDGGVAQIEDVNTLEEHRGRGGARAVVLGAAAAARDEGADLVFLVADDEDWPKLLYSRLGFDPAGPAWEFVRPPAS